MSSYFTVEDIKQLTSLQNLKTLIYSNYGTGICPNAIDIPELNNRIKSGKLRIYC